MAASHTKLLNIIATALLAVTAITCFSLGKWQLSRADERKQIAAEIQSGRAGARLALRSNTPADQLQARRPAVAEGFWQPQFSLLLDNRNLNGRPGLWLATPLLLAEGHAVLVLRGWFARPIGDQGVIRIPTPEGLQQIQGELSLRVPRLFELWQASQQAEQGLPLDWPVHVDKQKNLVESRDLIRLQNIDLDQLSKRTGIKFLPIVLMQQEGHADGLIRSWPEPSIDFDKNTGYAMQWFGFAAIAVFAWMGFAWRYWQKRRNLQRRKTP